MTVPVKVKGGNGNETLDLVDRDGKCGAVVFTTPLLESRAIIVPYTNETNGINLAVDAGFGGTPIPIHDGIDSTLWTGSEIVGSKVTFDSTAQANSGSNSVLINRATVNDTFQFDNGSTIDLTGKTAITMFIYVDNSWALGDDIVIHGYNTGTASIVGNEVELNDYFNFFNLGSWQKLAIPFADMGLTNTTIDAFRITVNSKSGSAPLWYIDDFQIEETGGGVKYRVQPPKGFVFRFNKLRLIAAFTGTTISHDKFFSLNALTNGLTISSQVDNDVVFSFTSRDIIDLTTGGLDIITRESDATNTFVTMDVFFPGSIKFDSQRGDFSEITINDDLSTILSLTMIAQISAETL